MTGALDAMLARTAARRPEQVAIHAYYGDVTYSELDAAATATAKALRKLLGDGDDVVAVASPLHPDFAVAFYGTIRAGKVVAPINPLLSATDLEHLLGTVNAGLVFVTAELYDRLRRISDRLPQLREAVLVGPGPRTHASDIRTLDDLMAAYETVRVPPGAPADLACVQFTSGTTGPPKGALLTHANLLANAAQVAAAHRIDGDAVILNHLPKYHLMHLNSAVYAGATQVLCAEWDPAAGVPLANARRATHYYSIPMRLTKLAAAPNLGELRLETVRCIASGGSALAPDVAKKLSAHFGVPVFQGYGLAETSPLTHSDGPDRMRIGSVGPTVADTRCRIVDPETRAEVPQGEEGEVQVRGPQVMRGYLDPDQPTGIDADGWLSTGDVGYLDPDGYLYLVDRIKDVFKCDNYLVSPAEVERVLAEQPGVRDCAVVDYPDDFSGAVAGALVVLAAGTTVADLEAHLAVRVPYYQRVRHYAVVDDIPRTANGKVSRRQLRGLLIDSRGADMGEDKRDLSNLVAAVTRFTTRDDPEAFERFFLEHVEYMRAQEGFGAHQAVRLVDDPRVYVNFGWWHSRDAFVAVTQSPEFREHQGVMRSLLEKADIDLCKNLYRVNADESAGTRGEFDTPLMHVTTYEVTGDPVEFERAFDAYAATVKGLYGFGYADLNRSFQRPTVYLSIGYWWDPAAYDKAAVTPEFARLGALATVTVETVRHVAWGRAVGAEDED